MIKSLGLAEQTIGNWVKAEVAGGSWEAVGKPVNADRMEITRLKAEVAKARIERDILKNKRGSMTPVGVKSAFALFWMRKAAVVRFLLERDSREKHGSYCPKPLYMAAPWLAAAGITTMVSHSSTGHMNLASMVMIAIFAFSCHCRGRRGALQAWRRGIPHRAPQEIIPFRQTSRWHMGL